MKNKVELILKDEINCKFVGIDAQDRREISQKFKFEIPGARFTPSVKLGRWDGKVGFFTIGGTTFINLLPEILPYLEKYEIELVDNRLPFNFEFDPIHADSYAHIMWPEGHTCQHTPIVLRDYQVDVINQFLKNPQAIQSVATAAGKTIITAALSHKCEKYGRTIVIVPNRTLVKQTEEDYRNLGLDVGVYFGTKKEYEKTHTICTWQSLNSLIKKTTNSEEAIMAFDQLTANLAGIICDECHGIKDNSLRKMLTDNFNNVGIRWGLTGTIPEEKFAQKAALVSIGEVINYLETHELQDQGILANCQVNILQLIEHGEYKLYQNEYKYLATNKKRLHYIADMIIPINSSGNTLVLVDRVETGKILEEYINETYGENTTVFIHGATKDKLRKQHYDDVKTSSNKLIIATSALAAVGINLPRLFNVVMIEPGKSFVKVIQSIGRGIRKSHDKDFVNIYDITSTAKFSKKHLGKRKKFYKNSKFPFTIRKIDYD